ncbi:hypothetical protein ED176_13915 [Enterococcus faecium]|nr:hypothetical protein [Enterococcus faecium]
MKQLESGLVSKKLSKNESTLLTQIHLCSFFGFFNHVTRKINPLYFTQIKEELSNYRLKVVT